jgi:hypothetical protein
VELAQSNYVFTRWTQLAFPFEHEEIVTFRLKVKPGGDNHFHFFGGKAHGRGSGIALSRQFMQPRFPQAFFSFASSFTCCYSAPFYPPFSPFIHPHLPQCQIFRIFPNPLSHRLIEDQKNPPLFLIRVISAHCRRSLFFLFFLNSLIH